VFHNVKHNKQFRQTTLITVGLTSILCGLGLSRAIPHVGLGWVIVIGIFALAAARKRTIIALIAIVAFGVLLGMWRGSVFLKELEPYRQLSGNQVVFISKVQSDATYNQQRQLSFDVTQIKFISPFKATAPGRITVSGIGETTVYRGDILQIEGKLSPTKGSRQARVSFSRFTAVNRDQSVIERARRLFIAGIATALPEPASSFGLGLLIGYRTSLPEITNEQLKIAGLTHIIAVSGYNLTIIVRAVRRLLKSWSKYQQTIACALLIFLFLLVTDFSASIVRASIVSSLSLAAWYYGRLFKPILLIVLTAVMTALWSPLYIWSDIGWYLSFLAFFGILVVSPLVTRMVYGKKKHVPQLSLVLTETLAAQVMTAPLILYVFSRASLVGLLSNMIIGPLVPLAMLFTLLAGLSGMIVPVLAGWLAWPARILLRYMLGLVELFAGVPNALVERAISLPIMLVLYALICSICVLLWRRIRLKYGTITDNDTII
jgi:competence protein ComEC